MRNLIRKVNVIQQLKYNLIKMNRLYFSILLFWIIYPQTIYAEKNQPRVGRKFAERYFAQQTPLEKEEQENVNSSQTSWIMLNIGSYLSSESYLWGSGTQKNTGRANYGVTYLVDQWKGFDRSFRLEFFEYYIDQERPRKFSISPLITFPLSQTRFPLYFGLGLGLGLFFNQLKGESDLSLDYQLVAGIRITEVFNRLGIFTELSMKNHFHIFSNGQLNGTTLNMGLIFTF